MTACTVPKCTLCPIQAGVRLVRSSFCRLDDFRRVRYLDIVQSGSSKDDLWLAIREEAISDVAQEPVLSSYYNSLILSHNLLEHALANLLALKLADPGLRLSSAKLFDIFRQAFEHDRDIQFAIRQDLRAIRERDPACVSYAHIFLHFKGFHAIQAQRVAHKLYVGGQTVVSLMIQSRVSEIFSVDIHPGARIGRGIVLDHATGVVIGETAVVGDNVTILHNVTLGGRGNEGARDRHPKIGSGVLLGAGTKVLGNIKVGDGAKIGAGSLVLKDVPPHGTAVGNPARLKG